jgi:hypothetical protein
MFGPGIGTMLLAMLIGGLIGGEILARLLPRWGYPKARRTVRLLMLVGVAAYAGCLLAASLTSHERVLARGETLKFCGFYLDCHLGVAVEGVDRQDSIGDTRAQGIFYVVRLRVSSDARQATLKLGNPTFKVLDGTGQSYDRAEAAERALARGSSDVQLTRPIAAGDSYEVQVVFDLPAGVAEPRLLVRDATGVDRVLEGILIGDDDSILHKRTTLALN